MYFMLLLVSIQILNDLTLISNVVSGSDVRGIQISRMRTPTMLDASTAGC